MKSTTGKAWKLRAKRAEAKVKQLQAALHSEEQKTTPDGFKNFIRSFAVTATEYEKLNMAQAIRTAHNSLNWGKL